jgi:hypothetical protein
VPPKPRLLARAEFARLRVENEDLLRLRNEVSQLRQGTQQLAAKVRKAELQAQEMLALSAAAAQTRPEQRTTIYSGTNKLTILDLEVPPPH